MKKGRYTVNVVSSNGEERVEYYEYSRFRMKIADAFHRTMDILGHPCCEEGLLGKNPHIHNITSRMTDAIVEWENDAHRLITTLKQGKCKPPTSSQ